METIKTKPIDSLIYLDESGIDDNEEYPYAWGKKGPRIYALKPGKRQKRLSIISALHKNTLKAPFVFEGSCNREVFETYLLKVLLPVLKPGQTIIMDNASFHKNGKIKALIESAGCDLLYLPAYSPDFNPIEHQWAPLKH
nr:IS630 family transposase [Candidatus Dependentiae bacterium]